MRSARRAARTGFQRDRFLRTGAGRGLCSLGITELPKEMCSARRAAGWDSKETGSLGRGQEGAFVRLE